MITAESYLKTRGLGEAPPLPASVVNYQVPIPQAPQATGNFWTGLSNTLSKITNIANTVAPAVTNVKTTVDALKNGTATQQTTVANYTPPGATQPGLSTGAKVAIGVGVAGGVGLLAYALRKKKK